MSVPRGGLFESQRHALAVFLGNPGGRQWWEANQHWWEADFRDYVDGLIREGEAAERATIARSTG